MIIFLESKYMEKKVSYVIIIILLLLVGFNLCKNKEELFSEPEFIIYTSKGCGHCDKLKSYWTDIENEIKKTNSTLINIECSEEPEKCNGVVGVPTMILKQGDSEIEYSGDRSPEDIRKFIEKNLQ